MHTLRYALLACVTQMLMFRRCQLMTDNSAMSTTTGFSSLLLQNALAKAA